VNETIERAKGHLSNDPGRGKLVTRGAALCLYITRPASQGADLLLDVAKFLQDKDPESKAFHHQHARVGLQESSPQNNFRRIIAAFVPAGEFCNHTVNYCPANKTRLDLNFLLALLNSKLADWYFRLGSTNAHVSHYQLYNLPCPIFADATTSPTPRIKFKAWPRPSVEPYRAIRHPAEDPWGVCVVFCCPNPGFVSSSRPDPHSAGAKRIR
jgi:hypothetical protein